MTQSDRQTDRYAPWGFVPYINMLRTPSTYVTRTIEHDAGQARWNALSEREQDARVRAAMGRAR